jgi:nucleotide-binding universal stress UspA family protein
MHCRGPDLQRFVAPEIIFGLGASRLAAQYGRNLGGSKALVVSDPGVLAAGWVQQVLASAEGAGLESTLFTGVTPNPRIEEVAAGAVAYAERGCDIIIAVGGGSAQSLVELRRMIFCTDFSDPFHRALDYALSAAAAYDAELTLLHVLEDIPNSANIEDAIAAASKQLEKLIPPEGVKPGKIKTLVRIGRAYQQIIELALEIRADLLIMAVRGRNALDLSVFGSTTYRVIQLGPWRERRVPPNVSIPWQSREL